MGNPPDLAPPEPTKSTAKTLAVVLLVVALVCVILNTVVWLVLMNTPYTKQEMWFILFTALAVMQLSAGLVAGIAFIVAVRRAQGIGTTRGVLGSVLGFLLAVGAPVGWVLGCAAQVLAAFGSGGAWGRPLRVRGRQLHPSLREGSDWTEGERPDPSGLDEDTRRALEALWLHDAQKEHASVPAFSRVSWLLAAVGAPAELTEWTHRAALEEIDHTRRCFALAAGYSGRSHTVEAMPDLLLGGLDCRADPLVTLAVESLSDGCQLEDFNADVAAECASVCAEPTTRGVLEQIAREERSHAELSWALLEWLVRERGSQVRGTIAEALADLERYPRPTAVSSLVARADPEKLRAHGRIPDERWAALWDARLIETRARVGQLLDEPARGGRQDAAQQAAAPL
jgi:hypothetical protein